MTTVTAVKNSLRLGEFKDRINFAGFAEAVQRADAAVGDPAGRRHLPGAGGQLGRRIDPACGVCPSRSAHRTGLCT